MPVEDRGRPADIVDDLTEAFCERLEALMNRGTSCEPSAVAVATRREVTQFIAYRLELAYMAFDQRKFDWCIRLAEEILIVDPHYTVAVELKEDAQKCRHNEEYWRFIRKKIDHWKNFTDCDEETVIPFSDTTRYPSRSEWREILKRFKSCVIPSSPPTLEALAAIRISFDLEKDSVGDVLRRLGVRIETPLPDGRPRPPLAATDVSGLDALSLIAAREDWTCEFRDDLVRLTPADAGGSAVP